MDLLASILAFVPLQPCLTFGSPSSLRFSHFRVGPYSGAILAVLFHTVLRMLNYQLLNGSVDDFDFTVQHPPEPEIDDTVYAEEAKAVAEVEEDDMEEDVEKGNGNGESVERKKMKKDGGESAVNLLVDADADDA